MAALTVLSLKCFHLSNSQVCPGVRTAVSSRLGLFINEQVIKRELNHSQIHLINSTFQFDRRITNLVQGNATKLVQQIHGCTAKSSISIPLPLLCVWYINWSSQYCDSENVSLCSSALNTHQSNQQRQRLA
ncbi:hypothetical protein BKA69DRAFT_476279 [Paraphysoderma sedebokerense]|nr:hypothetical protein BKA69DRAFT_476279 [Paraphysoderma sedebokerense]